MVRVVVALGSNVGDRRAWLLSALGHLSRATTLSHFAWSAVYQTQPVGMAEGTPWFLNMVLTADTTLTPLQLLALLQVTEAALGRQPQQHEGALPQNRTVDLDLLAYGTLTLATPTLTLPHPRLQERAFVLVPWLELDTTWRHPTLGLTVEALHAQLADPTHIELYDVIEPDEVHQAMLALATPL
jgi:2-amino-4-hydroxy-6-hydroxymethyldihydropteridine diphosphokinase